jgi:hypothetical protein
MIQTGRVSPAGWPALGLCEGRGLKKSHAHRRPGRATHWAQSDTNLGIEHAWPLNPAFQDCPARPAPRAGPAEAAQAVKINRRWVGLAFDDECSQVACPRRAAACSRETKARHCGRWHALVSREHATLVFK